MQNLMPQIDTPNNLFHDGNPVTGELGTIVSLEHLNNEQSAIRDTQSELIAILTAAAMTPESTAGQLLEVIKKLTLARENPGDDIKADGKIDTFLKNIGLNNMLKAGDFGLDSRDRQSAANNEHVSRFFLRKLSARHVVISNQCGCHTVRRPNAGRMGQFVVSYDTQIRVFAARKSSYEQQEITELFHDKRKPTSADTGSYPAIGGVLDGDMKANGNVTSGQDMSSGRDIYAQRNQIVTEGASVGLDLTVGKEFRHNRKY